MEIDITRFQVGNGQPEASNIKYAQLNRHFHTLVPTYINTETLNYLHGINGNVCNVFNVTNLYFSLATFLK